MNDKGVLGFCWGFTEETVTQVRHPTENQRILCNGHKCKHAIKFQSVVIPNGLVANIFGPIEGERHKIAKLAQSDLLTQLQVHSYGQNSRALCFYGDSVYPQMRHLQASFPGPGHTLQQSAFNKSMSEVRFNVGWVFKDISITLSFKILKRI